MAAVVEICEELMERGLVREAGVGVSTGGRPPMLLELVPRAYSAVGLEVGPRWLMAVVTDLNARVLVRSATPSCMERGPEELWARVRSVLEGVLAEAGKLESGDVVGIGLALPAPVFSGDRGFSPPSYPGWGRFELVEKVEQEYGLPVVADNDANASALGEHLFGAGRGFRQMLYVIAHRGVGGAVVIDGALYRGASGGAGEIGHTLVDVEGPRCGCGRYGCLEALVGHAAIVRRAVRVLRLAGERELAGRELERLTVDDVIDAARAGDGLARGVLEETGKYLGIGIANAVNLLDPEVVVVGGVTVRAGPLVLDPARRVFERRALSEMARRVRIVEGRLGEDAGAIGAASLVLSRLFCGWAVRGGGGEMAGRRSA
ncbi:ROK family protein [Rubrobacter calidifluminis]|uniref:ROK family protein n=1 Tax=Rubrobacter calidifluminis TaxID=1392640 RepID=UPI002362DDBE|nr:ROK family protein [Rubrobacter calidifluminis]